MNEQQLASVPGPDVAAVAEFAVKLGVSAELTAAQLKKLGEVLMESEMDAASPVRYTNRAARRAQERAERRRR